MVMVPKRERMLQGERKHSKHICCQVKKIRKSYERLKRFLKKGTNTNPKTETNEGNHTK